MDDALTLPDDVKAQLDRFEAAVESVETGLEPLLGADRRELEASLTPLERAKVHVALANAVSTLFSMYLKAVGLDPAEHAVRKELERVELVWCPFKRCAEDYYRNADARYDRSPSPQAEEDLYKRLGAMLGDTVECRDCASAFNAEFPMEGSNTRSIYQGLLDALCND